MTGCLLPDLLLLLYCARNVVEKEVPRAQLSRCSAPSQLLTSALPPHPTPPRSSNVVEKCLKLGGAGLNEQRDAVVEELMQSPNLSRLLQVRLRRAPRVSPRKAVAVPPGSWVAASWGWSGQT